MKKSYHSIVVPIVDATTAFRNCLLCSDADRPLCRAASYVAVLAIKVLLPNVRSPWSSLGCRSIRGLVSSRRWLKWPLKVNLQVVVA